MALVRWDPMSEFRSLARRMERFFGAQEPFGAVSPFERWPVSAFGAEYPPVDVYEDKEEIVLRAELPGMEQKEVEVLLDDSTVSLRGERKLVKEDKRENYQRIESCYGAFSRTFTLPSTIDRDKLRAEMKNGILEVHVPKREGAKGKAIPIHS